MPDSSGSVDLSQVGAKTPPNLENLSPDDQAIIDKMAEEHNGPEKPEGEPVRTAFLVIVGKDGAAGITSDLDFKVVRDYVPTMDDIYGAVNIIAKDVVVAETANGTAQFMQQMAQQQMAAMRNAQIAQGLNLPGGAH